MAPVQRIGSTRPVPSGIRKLNLWMPRPYVQLAAVRNQKVTTARAQSGWLQRVLRCPSAHPSGTTDTAAPLSMVRCHST